MGADGAVGRRATCKSNTHATPTIPELRRSGPRYAVQSPRRLDAARAAPLHERSSAEALYLFLGTVARHVQPLPPPRLPLDPSYVAFQASVFATTSKILSAHGPIPVVPREHRPPAAQVRPGIGGDQASGKAKGHAAAGGGSGGDDDAPEATAPALVVLVVKVSVLERVLGPLVGFIEKHPLPKQAGVYSRVVC